MRETIHFDIQVPVEADVWFTRTRGRIAAYNKFGYKEEPDEPDEIEIEKYVIKIFGTEIPLSECGRFFLDALYDNLEE